MPSVVPIWRDNQFVGSSIFDIFHTETYGRASSISTVFGLLVLGSWQGHSLIASGMF